MSARGVPVEEPLLDVRDLNVSLPTDDGVVRAVEGVSLTVGRGESVGIVGESGSGKTMTALAIMGLVPSVRARVSGRLLFDGTDLLGLTRDQLRRVRGKRIAMIFQDPLSSLNPYHRIGAQLEEGILAHNPVGTDEARRRSIEMLRLVGIPDPASRASAFPHELSGGMRQRVMIAMALSCDPDLLIADEPTTALDVTVQAQVLELIKSLQARLHSALVIISHDLGVIAGMVQRVYVMYAGRIVEQGPSKAVFARSHHPYTWGLLGSIARMDEARRDRLRTIPGLPPSLVHVPSGCAFHPRCRHRIENRCRVEVPVLLEAGDGHLAACHLEPAERDVLRAQGITG